MELKRNLNYLIIIDMQNDFVKNSPFATKEAQEIIPYIKKLISSNEFDRYIFTRDTHSINQETIETLNLPRHCIYESSGWAIVDELFPCEKQSTIINKVTYGIMSEDSFLKIFPTTLTRKDTITIVGVCTDICVISNALILRSRFPNIPIYVDSKGCAGTTPENHQKALDIMKMNSIEIL